MPEVLTPHNESLMPITMGSPYRVPDYAYPNWGLQYRGETKANKTYQAEWSIGDAKQLMLVSMATMAAGFDDYPELLRRATARVVSALVEQGNHFSSLHILDLGAGPGKSAVAIYEALPERVREKTEITLLDPSASSLQTAEELMRTRGIKHKIVCGIDSEVSDQIQPGSVDIVTAVASIHHHARIPFGLYERVLKPGGSLVIADWHHDIWEHPGRVLKFLERFNWPQKEAGLANWKAVYPQAIKDADNNLQLTPAELMAREQITRFWLAYKNVVGKTNPIWPLEGHRPVSRYITGMQEAGLYTGAPQQLLPDSTLLMVTVGHKPKKHITTVRCGII